MVRTQAELATLLQFVSDQPDGAIVHHPALGVSGLGPRIGMQQVDHGQGRIGQPGKHFQRITMMQANVGKVAIVGMGQSASDSVQVRLGPDEAMVGQEIGTVGEMLSAAEADLQMQWPVITEQPGRGDRPIGGQGDPWQETIDQCLRFGAQRLANGAAI